ncbi:MAG TPA: AmmeMemoRadiSam system protein B [Gammaproteobacteria bacterium]|nr:AmmeMemoRadiSam system protein B [Gammaproteobacteria bacterium]
MKSFRAPAVAGTFYPAHPQELKQMVDGFLDEVAIHTHSSPKALIVPHAGYIYSGPIAATAYAQLASMRDKINRVIVLGPAHRVAFHGLAVPSVASFNMAFGQIPVDQSTIEKLVQLPQVSVMDEAHQLEHSLEVQLPFLDTVLDHFTLVPIVVGEASAQQVAEVIESCWGGEETLIVVSSDLSHYEQYETAKKIDRETCQQIEALEWQALTYSSACGCQAICGLLLIAQRLNLSIKLIDLRSSGDTAGDHHRVVGYGAFVVSPC